MTQKDVIQRILTELVTAEVITDDNHNLVKMYLQQAYGAGFDMARRLAHPGKMIIQCSMEGKPIKVWENASIASYALRVHSPSIRKCANGKMKSSGGFRWKFLNDDPTTSASVESIESTRLESIQPKQGTHVSKISSV